MHLECTRPAEPPPTCPFILTYNVKEPADNKPDNRSFPLSLAKKPLSVHVATAATAPKEQHRCGDTPSTDTHHIGQAIR